MKDAGIKSIKAREILDSRGDPTVGVYLITNQGSFFGAAPSGSSMGKYEAVELRDGGKRYHGKGVLKAVENVNKVIAPKLIGQDPINQKEIDKLLIELDGTKNKSKLGANAIVPVSIAVAKAGATAKGMPLYQHLAEISGKKGIIPKPCFNVINGGIHAGNDLDIQEFMIVPELSSFKDCLRAGTEVYHQLRQVIIKKYSDLAVNVGDEGGFAPPLKSSKEALDLIEKAVKEAGYEGKIKFILDCAASQFYRKGKYQLESKELTRKSLLDYYSDLIGKYPILGLEDPFSEEDWEGFEEITKKFGKKIMVIGDDLLVTNSKKIKEAQEKKAANAVIIKINQIGTVTEAMEAVKMAKDFDWKIIVSHRSGETCDNFIADFAVGIEAEFIKSGTVARGERVVKYNKLLEIEETI
ncbi:MAG: phosphopyruvate hydratase [Parcubacteria group bacterium]|nr:phosphopyruvate hydratase [Parcubacteria group bacterium]|tara:strand:- start:9533 stop:10765 length:1233 start_codon:yes stop_codon:yes gene_type:complete